jgi:hypothetical protein
VKDKIAQSNFDSSSSDEMGMSHIGEIGNWSGTRSGVGSQCSNLELYEFSKGPLSFNPKKPHFYYVAKITKDKSKCNE